MYNSNNSASKLDVGPRNFDKVTKMHCRLACLGKWCKHENWKKCLTQPPYILGLHSECVAGLLIGSQRLSDRLIEEYGII